MMVIAPSGALLLGVIAGLGKYPEQATYLWVGFAFCLVCILITIYLLVYARYRKSFDPDYNGYWTLGLY